MWRGAVLVLPLTLAAYFLARLPGLSVLGPLGLALLLAAGWRAAFGVPAGSDSGVRFFARPVLRFAIVLMGVRLDFGKVAAAGVRVLAVDVAVVAVGLGIAVWIGRRLGVGARLATLLGVGSAICGASAVAAVGPIVRAEEDEVAVSIGLISLLGTAGVVLYPALARALQLSDSAYGLLCGATLHEVPQVLAAAFARGAAAGDLGTLVKLTRVVLLAPAALVIAALETRRAGEPVSLRHLPVPFFVVGFVLVGVARTVGLIPPAAAAWLEQASKLLLVAAMAAVGLGVHLAAVRRLGWAPVVLGVLAWLAVIATGWVAAAGLGLLRR